MPIFDVILLSEINAFKILYGSTPGIFSEIFAISLENEINMEKNALFVYFINSDDSKFVSINSHLSLKSENISLTNNFVSLSELPMTILSGFIKSSNALPSRKNSGTTANPNPNLDNS